MFWYPTAYIDRLTMPKYVVTAGSDEFFPPDDSHYYYDDMKGPTYLRYAQQFALSETFYRFLTKFTLVIFKAITRKQFLRKSTRNGL